MVRLSLGIDLSTKSITGSAIDIDTGDLVFETSLGYVSDSRLNRFGIDHKTYVVPPRDTGEADQPPCMYLAALDALFSDMSVTVPMGDITVVNVSAQQHGHVYLNRPARDYFAGLRESSSAGSDLVSLVGDSFSYGTAPIWMTSNTSKEADFIRDHVGGVENMVRLSGSNSPLRFTGAVIRRVGMQFTDLYKSTEKIHLLSSFIPAVLTGDVGVDVDFGNAAGMSLMDYQKKEWSQDLLGAVSPEYAGSSRLRAKLSLITSPSSPVGFVASYFQEKYGFSANAAVLSGSGDNPMSKVVAPGDQLSLGTSFVFMTETDGGVDLAGNANAMYDGLGNPFMFGCRTNGAGVWDQVRTRFGLKEKEFGPAEEALAAAPVGSSKMFLWQPEEESFPVSSALGKKRVGYDTPSLAVDYPGIVDSSLAAVAVHSKDFMVHSDDPLYVVGGGANSHEVVRRVAAIFNRPVYPIEGGSASRGAAVAGAYQFLKLSGVASPDLDRLRSGSVETRAIRTPNPIDVEAYHKPGGFLDRFREAEKDLLKL